MTRQNEIVNLQNQQLKYVQQKLAIKTAVVKQVDTRHVDICDRYNRDWRYHKDEQVWITRAAGMEPQIKSNTYERGHYYVFDPNNWRRVSVNSCDQFSCDLTTCSNEVLL